MGLQFPDCAECQRLWHEYASLTEQYFCLDSQLKSSVTGHDLPRIALLTKETEKALSLREACRKSILQHESVHIKTAIA
jgi:hypothetical protein